MRILLVEDNAAEALLIREQVAEADAATYGLERIDFVEARTLTAALALLRGAELDMIVSDLTLPDSVGMATVAALLEAAPTLPLIVLTGNEDRRLGQEAVQRGAQDFLTKRLFTADVFLRAVVYAFERQQLREKIARLAVIDELTGVANRRYCFQELRRLATMAQRYGSPLSLFISDIDHFKRVNDTHGHLVGDDVLRGVADTMRSTLRAVDVFCRYGGEEFVALLPEIGSAGALQTAERMRQAVATKPCVSGDLTIPVTVSIGVATLRDSDSADTL
ncbi:MAG TPA: diguanylate cyclase, partial [bacterium]|nr:diguanylate cyclase [bacterium]